MDLVASLTLGLALVCAWQTPASEGRHGGGHLRLVRGALSPARCPISTHSWLVDLFFFFLKITPLAQTYCMALGAVSSFGHLTW